MDSVLFDLVRDRVAASSLSERARAYVLAACLGDEALDAALAGVDEAPVAVAAPPAARPAPAWLTRLAVEGFRGIGAPVALALEPGPGLHLITGRNGSGKSSLSEALETALSGTCRRWSKGTADARAAWRNLHGGAPRIEVDLLRDGQPMRAVRTWAPEADLDAGTCEAPPFSPQELDVRNPFLAYSDLGALFSGRPSDLHDELARILGLGALGEALERLRARHKARTSADKAVRDQATELARRLEASADPRAARALAALAARDLDAIEAIGAEPAHGSDPLARRDQAIREWAVPTDLAARAATLREQGSRRAGLEREVAGRAHKLAGLLREALTWPDASCPVCQTPGVLDERWREQARARLVDAEADAKALRDVTGEVSATMDGLRSAFARPAGVSEADLAGQGDPGAWAAWAEGAGIDDPIALADHVERHAEPFLAWLEALRQAAAARLAAAETGWRPLRATLATWVVAARQAAEGLTPVAELKAAEKWLVSAQDALRAERFEPIATEAKAIWATLRQESSVELVSIKLDSLRQRRKVELEVRVDDEEAPALGVMSQGELMSLALGLFVPRLAADDSPFGFVVIDDPVQSMDPHKVDGLALVLADLSKTRQVVVLTHDTRLRDALVRLAIGHRAWRVERGLRSSVEIRELDHPIEQPLSDANRVMTDGDALGDPIVRSVVPGFCREAIEIALATLVRRRRLGAGEPHADVEDAIRRARGSRSLAALALFDDVRARDDVALRLAELAGVDAADAYTATAQGAHEGAAGDLKALIRNTRKLARAILEVPT